MKKLNLSFEKLEPFFDKVAKLSKLYRALISIGVIAVLVAPFVFFAFMPKFDQISALKTEFEELDGKLTIARAKAMQLKKIKMMLKDAEGGFEIAKQKLPQAKEIPNLLAHITASGQDARLAFHLFKPEAETAKGFYAEIPVSIEIVGKYTNVASFFEKIGELSRIVNLKNIKIQPRKDSRELKTTCTAVTYMFIESEGT